jgi:hypothetical protein
MGGVASLKNEASEKRAKTWWYVWGKKRAKSGDKYEPNLECGIDHAVCVLRAVV